MVRLDHVVTQLLQAAETFVADFAGEDRVDMVLCTWLRFRVPPGGDLIVRDNLFVMLSLLHVLGQQLQTSVALTAAHALEDVSRLLIRPTDPIS